MKEGMDISLNDIVAPSFESADLSHECLRASSSLSLPKSDKLLAQTEKKCDYSANSFRRAVSSPKLDFLKPCSSPDMRNKLENEVVTWNIAAPNTNPFEFWTSYGEKDYDALMNSVYELWDCPDCHDVEVSEIFSPALYSELREELSYLGIENLDQLDDIWANDIKHQRVISEFLHNKQIGEKRLISMPDRTTSSVKSTEHGHLIFRPSPVTASLDEIPDVSSWWVLWKRYMFRTRPIVRGDIKQSVFSLLEPIPRSKYPALTEAEEFLSIPLQALYLAVFDAAFTFILSSVAPETWQPVKRSLRQALFENKAAACVAILASQYGQADLIMVQEASEAFAARAGVLLDHMVLRAAGTDGRRSQMSLVLAHRRRFTEGNARDVTAQVLARLETRCVQAGDLCVFELAGRDGVQWLVASFHGDSGGRATGPVVAAVHALAQESFPRHRLVVGLDANTSGGGDDRRGWLGTRQLSGLLEQRGLASCWEGQDLGGLWTSFSARTPLQAQPHKAVALGDLGDGRHRQLKDWILFDPHQLSLTAVARDNSGRRHLLPHAMPSLAFPSDHAIVAATLRPRRRARTSSLPDASLFGVCLFAPLPTPHASVHDPPATAAHAACGEVPPMRLWRSVSAAWAGTREGGGEGQDAGGSSPPSPPLSPSPPRSPPPPLSPTTLALS